MAVTEQLLQWLRLRAKEREAVKIEVAMVREKEVVSVLARNKTLIRCAR